MLGMRKRDNHSVLIYIGVVVEIDGASLGYRDLVESYRGVRGHRDLNLFAVSIVSSKVLAQVQCNHHIEGECSKLYGCLLFPACAYFRAKIRRHHFHSPV